MEFEAITMKITVRKIGRSLYVLIPTQIVKELKVTEGDEATVLVNYDERVFAYSLQEDT